MNKFTALFLCFCFFGFSQKKTDTLRLYYGINEAISHQNFLRVDSAVNALNKNVDVAIYGFADFLSSDPYNLELSQKRADAIKKHIADKKSGFINIYACEGKGEKNSKDNSSAEGDPKQRRVDIYFEPIVTLKVAESFLETPKDSVPKKEKKKKIEELNAGESIAVEGLSFVPGRHLILESSVPALQKLLKTLKDNPKLKIEVQGHVCCTEGDADGLDYDTM
jgi:outer membrane protein OmpA-like peptidoglycan-associated protein